MEKEDKGCTVQLSGEELQHARIAMAEIKKHLATVVGIIQTTLAKEKRSLGPKGISDILIRPGNDKIVVRDSEGFCVGVLEDPPGWCRNCRIDEWPAPGSSVA